MLDRFVFVVVELKITLQSSCFLTDNRLFLWKYSVSTS